MQTGFWTGSPEGDAEGEGERVTRGEGLGVAVGLDARVPVTVTAALPVSFKTFSVAPSLAAKENACDKALLNLIKVGVPPVAVFPLRVIVPTFVGDCIAF